MIATGSPFAPVRLSGRTYPIAQANNALVFPGLGLGTIVTRARTVSDGMLAAAAGAVAALTEPGSTEAAVLPAVENLRPLSVRVAGAVAIAAIEEGLARVTPTDLEAEIHRIMWQPVYRPVVPG